MNISSHHLDALTNLGYTCEEARFIYIVAVHSGYFTHRQFLRFSQTKPGKHSQKFITKLWTQGHANFHVYQSGGRVYHVFSRRVFKPIDRDNLRTRRRHQLDYIKTRLIALDFVLSNPDYNYIETEAEKVPFFETQLQVNRDLLPSKLYASTSSSRKTTRYFVDRFPMFLRNFSSRPPVVVLTYLDPGFATLQGFTTHLHAYADFLRALPPFEFIYVAPCERFFNAAETEFSRVVFGRVAPPSNDELLKYFRIRRAWERNERVRAMDVVFLNESKARFSGKACESLYGKWVEGTVREGDLRSSLITPASDAKATFSTFKCGDSLSVFSDPNEEFGESTANNSSKGVAPELSPQVSQS